MGSDCTNKGIIMGVLTCTITMPTELKCDVHVLLPCLLEPKYDVHVLLPCLLGAAAYFIITTSMSITTTYYNMLSGSMNV